MSYDYSGDFFNSNIPQVVNNTIGAAALIRSSLPTQMDNKKVLNNVRMKTISTFIEN